MWRIPTSLFERRQQFCSLLADAFVLALLLQPLDVLSGARGLPKQVATASVMKDFEHRIAVLGRFQS